MVVLKPGTERNKQNRGSLSLGQGKTFFLYSTARAVLQSGDQRLGLLHTVQYALQGDLEAERAEGMYGTVQWYCSKSHSPD